jgi:hypothetical protein
MRSCDNTYADVSPEVTAATETMKQKLAEIAATLKTKGINAAAEYDAPDPTVPAIGSIMSLLERIEMADIQTAKSSEMPDFKSVMDNVTSSVSGLKDNADNKNNARRYDNTNDVETQTGKQSLGQDDSVSQLSSLNSKLEQLISINSQLANINSDQLRVQKGFSFGDMFKSPV